MAIISRMLTQSLIPRSFLRSPAALTTHHRHRSSKSHQAQLIEIDLDSSTPSDEVIAVGMKSLEDAIHGIIVRRAAPDWLPFLPGYSYWVPPSRTAGSSIRKLPSSEAMIDVFRKLSARNPIDDDDDDVDEGSSLSDEEHMSCTSPKGWPSSSFFIDHSTTPMPLPVVDVELHVPVVGDGNSDRSSNSDEEG